MKPKQALLIIAPIMPEEKDREQIASMLSFLEPFYRLDCIDPLSIIDRNLPNAAYYQAWQQQITGYLDQYQGFIGFSFGGVILQQCFPIFEQLPRSVLLFSTPTFADEALKQKLGHVIALCEKNQVQQALTALYNDVYYPRQQPQRTWALQDAAETALRMINGLNRVLTTDSTTIVNSTKLAHLHLIGERSHLVNQQNVIPPQSGQLIAVPGAGMRFLEDNLAFCKRLILERFHCEIE